MSNTAPPDGTTDQPPTLPEILAVWLEKTPQLTDTDDVIAAWFELKIELLRPITENPDHPENDRARHFAAKALQSVNTLRGRENQR